MNCPKCGAGVPEDNERCPSCGARIPEEGSKERRRLYIAIIAVIVVAAIIIAMAVPIVSAWFRPASEKYILNTSDLGQGWNASSPEHLSEFWMTFNYTGDSSAVSIGFRNESVTWTGSIVLCVMQSPTQAYTTYERIVTTWDIELPTNHTVTDISGGDHAAVFTQYSQYYDNPKAYVQTLYMQKGSVLVQIYLISERGLLINIQELEQIAQKQAAKIPA